MNYPSLRRILFPFVLSLLCAAAATQAPVVKLNGQIYDGHGGPFVSGTVYWIVSNSGSCCGYVPAGKTLTIQSGAMIKVPASEFNVYGTLDARGATFTSLKDDNVGGDTNGDGSASSPASGDWGGLTFHAGSEASVVDSCRFRYAGRGSLPSTIFVRSATSVTLTNNYIDDCDGVGIDFGWSISTITGNRIRRVTGVPMQGMAIGIAQFSGNTASDNLVGDYLRLLHHNNSWPSGPLTIRPAQSLNGSGVFVMADTDLLQSPPNGTLTVAAGTVFKFESRAGLGGRGGDVSIMGTATQPVHMISLHDDSVGGDTQKNGNTTVPQAGD